jgi:hypothetical protein
METIPGQFRDHPMAKMELECRIAAARINCNFAARPRKDVA